MFEVELAASNSSNNDQLKNSQGYQLRALSGKNQANAFDARDWQQTVEVPALSIELVNETLNYFVNCRERLNQMTKTYDDNDAYILLLQEKEVDLELAARIGQELLKQNKELRESIKTLEDELAKHQDYVQQLKHELASKTSLLNTYIEEEDEEEQNEPPSICENLKNTSVNTKLEEHVTFQLVESNKRLCELQDELMHKGEQSLVQQERIFRLEQQLRDSDRRSEDFAIENETLRKSILQSAEAQQELYDELKVCKKNFSELLSVFLELQKESRRNRNMQHHDPNLTDYFGEFDPIDNGNISFDSFTDSMPPPFEARHHMDEKRDEADSGLQSASSSTTSPCLCGDTDDDDNDDENDYHSKTRKHWMGFSSFMITTLVVLCISATIYPSTNSNLAQRLQIKLGR